MTEPKSEDTITVSRARTFKVRDVYEKFELHGTYNIDENATLEDVNRVQNAIETALNNHIVKCLGNEYGIRLHVGLPKEVIKKEVKEESKVTKPPTVEPSNECEFVDKDGRVCGKTLTADERKWSEKNFPGRLYCYRHQKLMKEHRQTISDWQS